MAGSLRKLSPVEIDYVIDGIGNFTAFILEEAIAAEESIRIFMTKSIEQYKLYIPVEAEVPINERSERDMESLDMLKREISIRFEQAKIKPGSMVGITAVESIIQPIQQMTLNSFHSSGSSKNVSFGIDGVKDIIEARLNPKITMASIFYNKSYNYIDILTDKQLDLIEFTTADLFSDIDIDNRMIDLYETYPWWYVNYGIIYNVDITQINMNQNFLRATVDLSKYYTFKVSMKEVCDIIKSTEKKLMKRKKSVINFECIYSPVLDLDGKKVMYLDIHIDTQTAIDIGNENAPGYDFNSTGNVAYTTLKQSFEGLMRSEIFLSGIRGIRDVYPVESPIIKIISSTQLVEKVDDGAIYDLFLSETLMINTGITVDKLLNLLIYMNIEILEEFSYQGEVEPVRPISRLRVKTNGDSPNQIIINRQKEELEMSNKYRIKLNGQISEIVKLKLDPIEENRRLLRLSPIMEPTEFYYMSTDLHVDTIGSNLIEFYSLDDVDETRTYSNNIYEMLSILGVEAVRTFLITVLNRAISFETYIDPQHIMLIADHMSRSGQIIGLTSHSNSKHKNMSVAMSRGSTKNMTNKAGMGLTHAKATNRSTGLDNILGNSPDVGYEHEWAEQTKIEFMNKYNENLDIQIRNTDFDLDSIMSVPSTNVSLKVPDEILQITENIEPVNVIEELIVEDTENVNVIDYQPLTPSNTEVNAIIDLIS